MGLMRNRKNAKNVSNTDAENAEEENLQHSNVKKFARQCKTKIEIQELKQMIFFNMVSLILYIVNILSQIRLLIKCYQQQEFWYIFAFLTIPLLVKTCRSFTFYNKKWINEKLKRNGNVFDPRDLLPDKESFFSFLMKWVLGLCLLCPIPRYCDLIKYANKAIEAKKTNDHTKNIYFVAMIWEEVEMIQLDQFDSFMESAPQILLSLHDIFKDGWNFEVFSMVLSAIGLLFSVGSLSWALVSYDEKICLMKGIKRDDRNNPGFIDFTTDDAMEDAINCITETTWKKNSLLTLLLFLANFSFIISRLIAFSLFSFSHGSLIWMACLAHLVPILIWHYFTQHYSVLDSVRLSFLHIFAYLYPSEKESNQVKHPRFSPAVYLFISACENVFLMLLWSQSFIKGDERPGIFSVPNYPWTEWTFFVPWSVQLVAIAVSLFFFFLFNKV